MSDTTLAFELFSLDRSGKVLLRNGMPIEVGQRGIALLKALIAARGGAVTKAELMETAWPDVVVEEGNLTVQIAALRKALGVAPDGGEWIVTVPRVGYRLARQSTVPPAVPHADLTSGLPMIAVLPFQNMSGDAEQEYLADGVVEDIITALSRFRSFAVVARTSSFIYKGRAVDVREVARDLGVRYVLEGSVRRSGERLRIAAQLVDGQTGAHLWAEIFDGSTEDIFAFQDVITEQVAMIVYPAIEQAEIERVRRKPPDSLNAYDLVLRGLPHWRAFTPEGNAEAIRLFLRAVDLDPSYAVAVSYAANALHNRKNFGWSPPVTDDDFGTCIALTRRAVELANGDAMILAQCGLTLANNAGEYEEGLVLIDAAIASNPNNVFVLQIAGVVHLHSGDLQRAHEYGHRAVEMHAGHAGAFLSLTLLAHVHMALGNFEEAKGWAERSLAANPDYEATHWMLIAASAKLGRLDEARRWAARLLKLRPETTTERIRLSQPKRYADRNANILEGMAIAGVPVG